MEHLALEFIVPDDLEKFRGTVQEEGGIVLKFETLHILDDQKKSITAVPGLLFGSPILMRTPRN